MSVNQVGAIIEQGAEDWQLIQQDDDGLGAVALAGRWVSESPGRVEVRLVLEDSGVAISRSLDWHAAETAGDGTWSARIEGVPAGGLYRLETRFRPVGHTAGEWSPRGDMRHFLGVGDLWVIAGQSNSAGYGRGPVFDPPELGVHLFRNSEQWALATHPLNESTDTKHPVNREGANSGHSPYLHFGRLLKQHLGHPVGLVQSSLGGSPLCAWNPTEPGGAALYQNMLHCIRRAGGKVKGILWYQGESDAGETTAPTYAERFAAAVAAWRAALGNPALAVVTVQLNRVHQLASDAGDRGWSRVREAQRQVARQMPGVAVVPTFDLPLSDGIHTSPAGNMLLGERMARAALGAFYARPTAYLAPDLQSAHATDGGTVVHLEFAPVTSRIDTIDPTANPFRVEDSDDLVPITRVAYPQDATVRLELARPLCGPAVVHGGFGLDPETMPMDMERFLPLLGFYGAPVL